MPYVCVAGEDLYYRDVGVPGGLPVVILHSGWGYAYYPFDAAIDGIARRFVVPDRTGYGKSPARDDLPPGFHARYADETDGLLDALDIPRCAVWGHSNGAVIAALLAIGNPERFAGVVLEALHLDRVKPRSREFFTQMAEAPDSFGDRVAAKLAAEHGERWRTIIRADGRAWLHIAATPDEGLLDGRLHDLVVPTLVIHGAGDPRTEPGELDRLCEDVPHAQVHVLAAGKHSPHSEPLTSVEVTRLVAAFVHSVET